MIQFEDYEDNPLAPSALVCRVGGIFRVDTHLIRVTFVDDIPTADGKLHAVAQSHLVWKTAHDWLATRDVFAYAMAEFRQGTFGRPGVQ